MKSTLCVAVAALFLFVTTSHSAFAQSRTPAAHEKEGLMQIRTQFEFTVDAPFEQAAPLFGANEERKWSEGWNPQFVYPQPAHDQEGMVFRVSHGERSSIWVNTAFDLLNGHIQYVYVLSDAMTTLIDIHLTHASAQSTRVAVLYERTALMPEANEHVEHFAAMDERAAKEWSQAINGYFAKFRANPAPATK
jgi:hypothetical protein